MAPIREAREWGEDGRGEGRGRNALSTVFRLASSLIGRGTGEEGSLAQPLLSGRGRMQVHPLHGCPLAHAKLPCPGRLCQLPRAGAFPHTREGLRQREAAETFPCCQRLSLTCVATCRSVTAACSSLQRVATCKLHAPAGAVHGDVASVSLSVRGCYSCCCLVSPFLRGCGL